MSRSYKKNPICKDNKDSSKDNKQIANRTIRRKLKDHEFEMGNGNEYQKHYESYEIHDWVWRRTLEEDLKEFECNPDSWLRHRFKTKEEVAIAWKKEMLGK